MRQAITMATALLFFLAAVAAPSADGYLIDSTVPQAGGCPAFDRWNLSVASPLKSRWSTSLPPSPQTVLTVAAQGTTAQLAEIEQAIADSFGAWSGVTGTTFNVTNDPGVIVPLARVSSASACSNDQESNLDGLNTICFNQSSTGFASGVLAFTRVITANAPGASVGSSGPAAFSGQILEADTLFRNDGQAVFATPAALSTAQGKGAYDLESLLAHEIGHWFGLDHSAVWRALMFPFAPPPGQFLGARPTVQAPDGPLSDDDRSGIRLLYPDPNDAVNIGAIRGRLLPANPFVLADLASPSPGVSVTGIFGGHVVAVDADTGAVIAGTLGGWSCDPSNPRLEFDGSFDIERLPVGHKYSIYAEPLVGLATPGDFSVALGDLCPSSATTPCVTPSVATNFNPRARPAIP
ncbi:MAG TPA: matrixin family metalloprotease [Candidatus Acidoferrales bacterium]|nr:matrixin family metalloprotease [Candidatus Acidoferrales bacterium]